MVDRVLAVVFLDVSQGVLDEDGFEIPQARAARGVEHADVGEGATDEQRLDAVGTEPALQFGLIKGVVGVFDDDVIAILDGEFVDDFGLPRPFQNVFAPAVELVLVVGVIELLGWVDIPRVDHL